VRVQAAALLGEIGERRVQRSLQRLLRDPAREVRRAAERALEQLSSRPPLPLRVHLLGAFRIFRGNEPITDAAWKRTTAKVLLQYLVSQRPRMVPEEAILEALWPGSAPESAHAAFHAALHALRKVLEPDLTEARGSAYILGRKDQYGLNPRAECWVDAEEFERLARLGRIHEQGGAIEEAMTAFREADRLYAGDYLEESPYQEWTALQRERLRQLEVEVLLRLGELLAQSDAGAPIEAFRRAIALEPYAEPAYRGLMRLLAATGHRAEALQKYRTLERLLQRDLQVTPSSETTTLYRDLLTRDA
jgi:DNA-binding SARP family transcriptional activator